MLHCAVLHGSDTDTTLALLKHLISVAPETLEQKSSEGWTPLQVAVIKQRVPVIEYLIFVGANQRHRDKMGKNMVHSMLKPPVNLNKEARETLQKMLGLFDKAALKEMFLERCTDKPGALTPLAYFMTNHYGNCKDGEMISILTKYSSGEELSMINGEGDLPLHVVRIPVSILITSHSHILGYQKLPQHTNRTSPLSKSHPSLPRKRNRSHTPRNVPRYVHILLRRKRPQDRRLPSPLPPRPSRLQLCSSTTAQEFHSQEKRTRGK